MSNSIQCVAGCTSNCNCNLMYLYVDPNDKSLDLRDYVKLYDNAIKQNPQVNTFKVIINFPAQQKAVECSGNFINRTEFIRYIADILTL